MTIVNYLSAKLLKYLSLPLSLFNKFLEHSRWIYILNATPKNYKENSYYNGIDLANPLGEIFSMTSYTHLTTRIREIIFIYHGSNFP